MLRRLLLMLLSFAAVATFPASAAARDSDAPAGAPDDWLPPETWVMRHWLPYNEDDLRTVLGLRDRIALQGVVGDTRTLADYAQSKDLRPSAVVEQLVQPWRGRVPPARYRELKARAMRTFTQPHLAVHMFFHPFHIDLLNRDWEKLFGVSVRETYRDMYGRGLSYLGVAQLHRGTQVPLVAELRGMFRRVAAEGVRRREVLPSEARRLASFQSRAIGQWLSWTPKPTARAASASALCQLVRS